MGMEQRQVLEALARDQLIARARGAGVERAEVLTRPELIDEILCSEIDDQKERSQARGLLGLARDLVARAMQKGLHLPDASNKLRTLAPPSSGWRKGPPPIATVSLAEVYASQGHITRALEVLDNVISREPDHQYAIDLRARVALMDAAPALPEAIVSTGVDQEADDEWNPAVVPSADAIHLERAGGRSCVVRWALEPTSFAHARAKAPSGTLAIRVCEVRPSGKETERTVRDQDVHALVGRVVIPLAYDESAVCAALGWRTDGGFSALVA